MAKKKVRVKKKGVPPEQRENPEIVADEEQLTEEFLDAGEEITTADEAVVETAKEQRKADEPVVVTLITGAKATLLPVSPSLVQDVQVRIKDPPVPKFFNEDKGREEENPNHPSYLAALEQAESERVQATLNATIMFGVELEEGFEIDEKWVKKLKMLGFEIDEDDPDALEFAYKKYGVSNDILIQIGMLTGISKADVERMGEFFRG